MVDVTNRSRVQAGVPTGGEFAREAKAENPDLPTTATILDEDEWEAAYNSTESPSGEMVWTFDEAKSQPLQNVWSLVEGDDGGIYATPGFHVVNNIGYTVTEKQWDGSEEGIWQAPSDEDYDAGGFPVQTPEDIDRRVSAVLKLQGIKHRDRIDALTDAVGITAEPKFLGTTRKQGLDVHQWSYTMRNPRNGRTVEVPFEAAWAKKAPDANMIIQHEVLEAWIAEYEGRSNKARAAIAKMRDFLGEDYNAFVFSNKEGKR